jgi:hypothetical protein
MRIVDFSPGQRIALEHQAGDPTPPGVPGCVAIFVALIMLAFFGVLTVAIMNEGGEIPGLVVFGVGLVLTALAVRGILNSGPRYVSRLTIDRGADIRVEHGRAGKPPEVELLPARGLREIRITEDTRAFGGSRMAVAAGAIAKATGGSGLGDSPLTIAFYYDARDTDGDGISDAIGGSNPETPRFSKAFWVENVDTRQEVLDIAKRIAAVAGADYGEINRSDPRRAEFRFFIVPPDRPIDPDRAIDMTAESESAHDIAERYKADVTDHDGRLDGTIVPPWDPFQHPLEASLVEYVEGQRVVFEERFSGCAYCAVLGLFTVMRTVAGAIYGGAMSGREMDILQYAAMGFAAGAAAGTMLAKWLQSRPPKTCTLDLQSRTMQYTDASTDRTDDLTDATAVVLRRHHWVTRNKNSTTHWYKCYTEAELPDANASNGSRRVIVGWTKSCAGRDDPAYEAGIPYAGLVANALGVPVRYEEPN